MAVYRVGPSGATVFDSEGRVVARLQPGTTVVEGTIEATDSLAGIVAEHTADRRRYADKIVRPERGATS